MRSRYVVYAFVDNRNFGAHPTSVTQCSVSRENSSELSGTSNPLRYVLLGTAASVCHIFGFFARRLEKVYSSS